MADDKIAEIERLREAKAVEGKARRERLLDQFKEYAFLTTFLSKAKDNVVKDSIEPNLLEQSFKSGETILRTGDYSDAAYYIAAGVVEVRLSEAAAPVSRPTAKPALPAPSGPPLSDRLKKIFGRKPL